MKNILITGGSGLIGQKITKLLEKNGHQVAWLSRTPTKNSQKSFAWDVEAGTLDEKSISWADAIIHLAGEGVADKRWTTERKKAILQSRTHSTGLLFRAIKNADKKPQSFVSASAVGYYGFDTGDQLVDENAAAGKDFLAQVVIAWENSSKKFADLDIRTVLLRIGIVLDSGGGALKEMMSPPVAAPLGKGTQWMSWIQVEDLAKMFVFAVENENLQGIYNAVAPKPVTNRDLTQKAAKKIGKPFLGIGVPALGLKLLLGEMAQMVIGGNRVSSRKIQEAGFNFQYPNLVEALEKTYRKD